MKREIPTPFLILLLVTIFNGLVWVSVSRYNLESYEQAQLHISSKAISAIDNTTREYKALRDNSFQFVMNTLIIKCREKKIPINVALALIAIESRFDSNAISPTNDHGLFQINIPSWEKELKINKNRIYEPEYNIELGLTILQRYYNEAGTWPMAMAMFNMGKNYAQSKHPEKFATSIFN